MRIPPNRRVKRLLEGTLGRDFRDYWFKLFSPAHFKPSQDIDDADMSLEHLLDTLWIVGSPDHVANRLRELYEEVGGFGVLTRYGTRMGSQRAVVKLNDTPQERGNATTRRLDLKVTQVATNGF